MTVIYTMPFISTDLPGSLSFDNSFTRPSIFLQPVSVPLESKWQRQTAPDPAYRDREMSPTETIQTLKQSLKLTIICFPFYKKDTSYIWYIVRINTLQWCLDMSMWQWCVSCVSTDVLMTASMSYDVLPVYVNWCLTYVLENWCLSWVSDNWCFTCVS